MAINRVFLAGNLTRDPSLRATPSGMQILELGLAVSERRKNQQTGEWDSVPQYFDLKVFGARAEALGRILTKGTHISIEGHLHWSQWEDKNSGQKRSKVEVIVDELEIMSSRQGNAPQGAPAPQSAPQNGRGYTNPPQPQMAPQMAPQAPTAAPTYGGYQPTQQPPAQQQSEFYDESIPF